jgi:hypothetical protein
MASSPHATPAGSDPALSNPAASNAYPRPATRVRLADQFARSLTLQQYGRTLAWTFLSIAVCGVGYLIEKYVVMQQFGLISDSLHRMFKNPAELPMRLFGLPHFVVGTLFLFSSRRMKERGAALWFIGLALAGTGLCCLFYTFGQGPVELSNGRHEFKFYPLAVLLFYFYFLIHGFRDEAFFYRAYGEMPKDQADTHKRIMVVLQLLLLGLVIALGIPAYALYGQLFRDEFRDDTLALIFPAQWPYAWRFFSLLIPVVIFGVIALRRTSRVFPDGVRGLWRVHYPIMFVFTVSTGIVLLALFSGPWTFNAVVLMHFVAWYIFARVNLARRPPAQPPQSTWQWMRQTKTGFTVLHIGLAVVVTLLVALSAYGFGKEGWLELIVGSKAFYYWTIMHVTLSFFPR